jgi:hypothetical protein
MIGQILPNNNERCYSNFSPTFREVNTPPVLSGPYASILAQWEYTGHEEMGASCNTPGVTILIKSELSNDHALSLCIKA